MNIVRRQIRNIDLPSASALGLGLAALLGGIAGVHAPRAMAPLAGIAAILCLTHLVRQGTPAVLKTAGFGVLLAALLVWTLVSTQWGVAGAPLLNHALRKAPILVVVLLILAMADTPSARDREWMRQCLTAGFAALLVITATELLSQGWILRTVAPEKLGDGPWQDVYTSRGLVILSLMLWPALIALRRYGTALTVGAVCVAVILSLLASHHATRLALAIGIVVFLIVYRFGKPAVLTIGFACAAFIMIAPVLSYGPLSPDQAWTEALSLKNSAAHRLHIWQFVSDRIWERPLLGWGMGASRYIPGGELATPVGGTFISLHPHSAPLQLWLELGAVGAALGAAIVACAGWLLANVTEDRFRRAAVSAALAAGFSIAAIGFGLWQSWWLATLGLIAAWSIALLDPKAQPRDEA